MIEIIDKSDCCGCTACAGVCPQNAIVMQEDALGFKYPIVDKNICIDCGLCEEVCTFSENYDTKTNFKNPIIFGARNKDEKELLSSRSGGVFPTLAKQIIDINGVVYGVGFSKSFVVQHKRADNLIQCKEFKGSKYVQSDLDDIFQKVKEDLKESRTVLFSGTPCQIAGLKTLLGEKLTRNLITVDIVCHGVPSPYIWKDYLMWQQQRNKNEITEVQFRNKKFGWFDHVESIKLGNKKIIYSTIYSNLYYKHIMLRPCCGKCFFCNTHRPSDITLADFWGWEKTNPSFNIDDKGVSLVLCNTPKGKKLFESVIDNFNVIQPEIKNCMQTHLQSPTTLNPLSVSFYQDYSLYGFEYVLNKYGRVSTIQKIRRKLGKLRRKTISYFKKLYK